MFKIENNEIYLTRGDSAEFDLKLEKDGEEYDFSNDRVVFSVKKFPCDLKVLLQKEFANGKVNLTSNDTMNLPFGRYFYDVVLYKDNDVITVITPCAFTIGEEVHK